jgi:hypothetical protein
MYNNTNNNVKHKISMYAGILNTKNTKSNLEGTNHSF